MNWSPNEGISLETHKDYITEFGDLFFEQVKKLIDLNQSKNDEFLQKLHKNDQILFQVSFFSRIFVDKKVFSK